MLLLLRLALVQCRVQRLIPRLEQADGKPVLLGTSKCVLGSLAWTRQRNKFSKYRSKRANANMEENRCGAANAMQAEGTQQLFRLKCEKHATDYDRPSSFFVF